MKRVLLGVSVLGAMAALAGCPIYPSDSDGSNYQVCNSDACFDCPDSTYSNACVYWSCNTTADCPYGYNCTQVVTPGNSGYACFAAGESEAGTTADCASGCPSGYECAVDNGAPTCVPIGALPVDDSGVVTLMDATGPTVDGSSADATTPWTDAASGEGGYSEAGPSTSDGGASSDGATGGSSLPEAGALGGLCNADSQCTAASPTAKCVDGLCTPQSQLCSDGTQCLAAGDVCVDGICLPTCSTQSSACPAGYSCDFNIGACSLNQAPCPATACTGGSVCVDSHCAAPCGAADAGAQCAVGQVCVNGGCIPDQEAQFTCSIDGATCTLAGGGTGICVHGDCYVGCADAGSCTGSAPVCKEVPDNRGSYDICGTATNLGDQCNPAVGEYCTGGKVCVDGYCELP